MKGTFSMGKKSRGHTHIPCRRCGHTSYHKSHHVCAKCGYGKTSKIRKYSWQQLRKQDKMKK